MKKLFTTLLLFCFVSIATSQTLLIDTISGGIQFTQVSNGAVYTYSNSASLYAMIDNQDKLKTFNKLGGQILGSFLFSDVQVNGATYPSTTLLLNALQSLDAYNPSGNITVNCGGSGGGSTIYANNGDTIIGDTIGLGGTLIRNTLINLNGHELFIKNGNTTFINGFMDFGAGLNEFSGSVYMDSSFTSISGLADIGLGAPVPFNYSINGDLNAVVFYAPDFIQTTVEDATFTSEIEHSGESISMNATGLNFISENFEISASSEIQMRTPNVENSLSEVKQVLALQGINGEIEFQSLYELTTSWSTANRPATPQAGYIGFNTTISQMEYYDGTSWVQF